MINVKEAAVLLAKLYPKDSVTKILDFDTDWGFLLDSLEDPRVGVSYQLISKQRGEWSELSIIPDNLEKIYKAKEVSLNAIR